MASKTSNRRRTADQSGPAAPLYFLSLALENVLCFREQQTLDLSDGRGNPAQWTVILGSNGVGKTTLLRCIAGMEIKLLNGGGGGGGSGSGSGSGSEGEDLSFPILYDTHRSDSMALWPDLLTLSNQSAEISAQLAHGLSLTEFHGVPARDSADDEPFVRCSIDLTVGSECSVSEELSSLQCYGYGAVRTPGETVLGRSLSSENSASLFSEQVSLLNAEEWLLRTDYAFRSASEPLRTRLRQQLDEVRDLLQRILPDVEDIRIAPPSEDYKHPRAEFLTPYGWVALASLGLGYRTAIAWMVDLAVRLFRRYPDSPDPLAEPAIVLVDEIDLHLHPRWQRTIMDFLTERFPNTQFIVTAHSPLVVQAAMDANLVLLRREGDRVIIDNQPEVINNWRVDQVLTSMFEVPSARPPQLDSLLDRRRHLLAKSVLSAKDQAELEILDAQMGGMPTAETVDYIRDMNIIREAARLLENSQ
jgi:energy-coupling factor transporter ATP-binding protein EcfA2